MAWLYVLFAGILEVGWVIGLKYAHTPLQWLVEILVIVASFYTIIKAAEKLPVGTVYAVFTGLGTAGVTLIDIFVFKNPLSLVKIVFLIILVIGIIGLKFVTEEE